MVDLCPRQIEKLREEISDRYGLEIEAKITRVEFESEGRNRVYFRAEDGWKAKEQPKAKKDVYLLEIYESEEDNEPNVMIFKALDAAMIAFSLLQKRNNIKIVLKENDAVIQTYENDSVKNKI